MADQPLPIPSTFTPSDWYWPADDGRVFASARVAVVTAADAGFAEAQAAGRVTRWPPDDKGAQTDAALNEVLMPYGLSTRGAFRTVRGAILVKALDKATKVCPRDLAYVAALDAAREDMASIVRIAGVDGRDPKAWFDLALGVAP